MTARAIDKCHHQTVWRFSPGMPDSIVRKKKNMTNNSLKYRFRSDSEMNAKRKQTKSRNMRKETLRSEKTKIITEIAYK